MSRARLLVACLLALGLLAVPAAADSFNPITLGITVTPVARLHALLKVTVAVHADPGVLDTAEGPMRVEVKLAPECGGDFQHTPGVTLINLALSPRPALGRSYSGSVTDAGRPVAYGAQTVCAFLEDSTVGRVYAHDESVTVNVSALCTAAAHRYDLDARALARARRHYRRAHGRAARRRAARFVTRRRRALARDRRRGLSACGRGVAL